MFTGFILGDIQVLKYFGVQSTVVKYSLNRINEVNGSNVNVNYKNVLDKKRNEQRIKQNTSATLVQTKLSYVKTLKSNSSNGNFEIETQHIFKVQAIDVENAIVYKGNVKTQVGGKPSQYLGINNNHIFIVQGDGSIIYSKISDVSKQNAFQSIPNNFDSISQGNLLYDGIGSGFSVKGVQVFSDSMYISFSNNQGTKENPCWNTAVATAKINFNFLEFKKFYFPKECALQRATNFSAFESGGAMVIYDNKFLLFSQGAYRNPQTPQVSSSIFGSIVKIELTEPSKVSIIAKGLRNSQGLLVDGNSLLLTEQGPMGGDEINSLLLSNSSDSIVNFGWPISSYGFHYNYSKEANFPLLKSHSAYGFREPLRFWTPSIAISSITTNPYFRQSDNLKGGYFVGAMGDNLLEGDLSIHYLNYMNGSTDYLEDYWTLPVSERDRSLITFQNKIFATTDSGRILLIEKI